MKKLAELNHILPIKIANIGELNITGISFDSRKVKQGELFFAIPGVHANGAEYSLEAVRNGAIAVVSAAGSTDIDLGVPIIEVDDPRQTLALVAAELFSGQPEIMVAVTGTSGKTSVVSFLRQIWEYAGYASASIGTTGVVAPGREEYGELTTPDPISLHRMLSSLYNDGVTHGAMEASSHGLSQHRLDAVKLSAGAFTNLGRDHMDYHPTIEEYHQTKMRLFNTLLPKGAPAVIFADDAWSQATIKVAKQANLEVLTVGRAGTFLTVKRAEYERSRQHAEIQFEGSIYEVELPLPGDFQLSNALVAAGLAIATGTGSETVFRALKHLKGASGRLELLGTTSSGAQIYVDYAHKPEALENVLKAIRPFTTGRIILVFGCGGDRDRGKRPIMGEIAGRLADVVIITDDNPRSEDPKTIRKEILAAIWSAEEIGNRREAIRSAIAMLKSGDTLIVAGKGHEQGQEIAGKKYPFSDHEEIRQALEELEA